MTYEENRDTALMAFLGITHVPMLQVEADNGDAQLLDYAGAMRYITGGDQ